jgi:putative transposase
MSAIRKFYGRDFKIMAVLLSYKGATISQTENELKITPSLLNRWRLQYEEFGTSSFGGHGKARVHPDNQTTFHLQKRLKESEIKLEILQKGIKHLYQGNVMIFQFIKSQEKTYRIGKMCEVLGVSHTSYSTWKRNGIPERQRRTICLKQEITAIFYENKEQFGKYKITAELRSRGYKISDTQVSFYMRQLGLRSKIKRKFKATTDSKHNYYTAPNILNQRFHAKEPSKVWVSDITYIHTTTGFSYLTIIMDLYDRKIIGWSLSNELRTTSTLLAAWEMAIKNRALSDRLIFHSDRGVQYASKLFVSKLNSYNCIVRSMCCKGNHMDNAVSESFFNTLKRELIHRIGPLDKNKIKDEIFEFIEEWYNKRRLHSTLGYKTIKEFNIINTV